MSEDVLTAGSLFTGIGGIDYALALAGFDIRYQVEINPFCREVLKKHAQTYWPNARPYADVFDCGNGRAHELPNVSLLAGGFPCQSVSIAGNGEGIAEGTASGLWFEFRRLIGEVRPRAVFLENVEAILYKGRGGTGVIADLAALGYVGQWGIISAADAGATHERDRWWCVGYAGGIGHEKQASRQFHRGDEKQYDTPRTGIGRNKMPEAVTAGQILVNAGSERRQEFDVSPGGRSMGQLAGRHYATGRRPVTRRRILESGMGRNAHGLSGELDTITGHQFPAPPGPQFDYEPARTTRDRDAERIAALGNAVVPQCVYPIAKLLAEVLRGA